jgi:hypothetical protein
MMMPSIPNGSKPTEAELTFTQSLLEKALEVSEAVPVIIRPYLVQRSHMNMWVLICGHSFPTRLTECPIRRHGVIW